LTKEIVMTARFLTAEELNRAGGLTELVPEEDDLFKRAQAFGEELAQRAPLTLWATKEALRRLRNFSIPDHSDSDILAACYLSRDFKEGVASFIEKRRPRWQGR
jgi:enoyl-CoA hydratase/carnithine racemase